MWVSLFFFLSLSSTISGECLSQGKMYDLCSRSSVVREYIYPKTFLNASTCHSHFPLKPLWTSTCWDVWLRWKRRSHCIPIHYPVDKEDWTQEWEQRAQWSARTWAAYCALYSISCAPSSLSTGYCNCIRHVRTHQRHLQEGDSWTGGGNNLAY